MGRSGRKFRKQVLVAVFLVTALLLVCLPLTSPGSLPLWLLLIGRLHPLVLHFPIVMILLALFLEIAARFDLIKKPKAILPVIIIGAALSTFIAIVAGYLLLASGDYSGTLVDRHFQAGAITGGAIFVSAALFFLSRKRNRFYPYYIGALLISAGYVGYTSHLGGGITHGPDYLTEYLPLLVSGEVSGINVPEDEMLVYRDMLQPIFEAKCLSCHNALKTKGGFLMTSYLDMVKGGESGKPGIVAGVPDSSELYRRVILPEEHEERMPPEGKTPLTAEEIKLLNYWIKHEAKENLAVAEIGGDTIIAPVVTNLLPTLETYHRQQAVVKAKTASIADELQRFARRWSVVITPDSVGGDGLFVLSMTFPPSPFGADQLAALRPYYNYFSRISLVSTGIDDDALYYVGQMNNLRELYLQKTRIRGPGLVYLQQLPQLELLNLSFTRVDDRHVIDLLKVPGLKTVYLFGSSVTPEVTHALNEYQRQTTLTLEEGPYQ